MRSQLHAKDLLGVLLGLVARFGQLDPTALATAASVDLRLDHHHAVAGSEQLLRRGIGLLEGNGHLPVGHTDAVASKNLFGLILVNLHACSMRRGLVCFVRCPW